MARAGTWSRKHRQSSALLATSSLRCRTMSCADGAASAYSPSRVRSGGASLFRRRPRCFCSKSASSRSRSKTNALMAIWGRRSSCPSSLIYLPREIRSAPRRQTHAPLSSMEAWIRMLANSVFGAKDRGVKASHAAQEECGGGARHSEPERNC